MDKPATVHEDLTREDDVKVGSDRGFGFVFAGFSAIVAGYMLWRGRVAFWPWISAAVAFACLAACFPRALRPLNVLWLKLGALLHYIVTPLVFGLMFFAVLTPIGLWMRIPGKRPLGLRFDRQVDSYWIARDPAGPPPESFNNQF